MKYLFRIASRISIRIASITFFSDSPAEIKEKEKICMCVDFSTGEGETYKPHSGKKKELQEMLESGDPEKEKIAREEAAKNSDPIRYKNKCFYCKGTGIETEKEKQDFEINYSNSNALAMLEVLGLPAEYNGEISIPEMKRALIRAKNRSSLEKFERPSETLTRLRKTEEGVTELHSPYFYSQGLDKHDIEDRLGSIERLVKEAEANGAKHIVWG
jgi:hypothetical protein